MIFNFFLIKRYFFILGTILLVFAIDFRVFFPFNTLKETIFPVIISLFILLYGKKLKVNLRIILLYIIFTYILILKFFYIKLLWYNINHVILFGLSVLFLSISIKFDKKKFFYYLEILSLVFNLLLIFQIIFVLPDYALNNKKLITGFLGGPNFNAFFIGICLLISIYKLSEKFNNISFLNILIGIPIFLYLRSRIAVIAFLLTNFYFLIFIKKKYFKYIFLFLVFFLGILILNFNILKSRFLNNFFSGKNERFFIWKISLNILKDYPFGIGLGNYGYFFLKYQKLFFENKKKYELPQYRTGNYAIEAHNEFLQFAIEGGIICLFVLLYLFLKLIIENKHKILEISILIFTFICGLTSFPYHMPVIAFLNLIILNDLFESKKSLVLKRSCFLIFTFIIFIYFSSQYIGNLYFFKGSFCKHNKKAINLLNIANNFLLINPRIYFELGNRYFLIKDFDKSEQYYKLSLKYSYMPSIYSNLASLFLEKKEFDKALNMIIMALKIDPKNLYYKYKLGFIYYYLKDYDIALSIIDEVIAKSYDWFLVEKAKKLKNIILNKR